VCCLLFYAVCCAVCCVGTGGAHLERLAASARPEDMARYKGKIQLPMRQVCGAVGLWGVWVGEYPEHERKSGRCQPSPATLA
jgi:hypothetical protein